MKTCSFNMIALRNAALTLTLVVAAACGAPPPGETVYDPLEGLNRTTHAVNKGLDTVLLRPASKAYDAVLPDVVEQGVSNFASNLSLPGKVVNHLLQANFQAASQNTLRFMVNSTFGLGGLMDPAGFHDTPEIDTGFGETLHVWGAGEGAYVELPVLGPSTARDTVGTVVDFLADPLSNVLPQGVSEARTGARVGEILQTRHSLGGQVDSLLYDSEDSYAQLRLLYLQNRRFALGGASGADFIDPYDDPYIDPYE